MTTKAFVIMPFSESFNGVYSLFIAPTLYEAGYEVFRADDIINQRNILEDIIEAIQKSDLIIADLTGSNPNVYYELGLAHALGKPVILLTQAVSELPFDLRSYRVIQYSTHFAEIGDAKANLLELVKTAKDGRVIFRNPVTDFCDVSIAKVVDNESVELGFLDHVVGMQDGFAAMTENVRKISEKMKDMNKLTQEVGEKVTEINQSGTPDGPRKMQKLLSNFAVAQTNYAHFLKNINDQLSKELNATSTSLDYVITYKKLSTAEEVVAAKSMLEGLNQVEEASQSSINSFTNVVTVLKRWPQMEQNLTKATQKVIAQLERYVGHTVQVVAMASKSKHTIKKMLQS